ncbi:ribonuclease activity regulator RraA [Thermorudis peleae]|uniref:ribonuclease activity regulator RraA n=1 Tax=Thermorudis peleae TaxID=1382356 RepID=UPI00056FEB6F|nr:ribonuclease activity regulator RraA [Thermorudis peleae]MBX6755143.1 ribonuclease activity regulator RraA [Thermorudis peleae]
MITVPDIERPPRELIEQLRHVSSATATGALYRLGFRDSHLRGLTAWTPGAHIVGPALTLQFMPKREDVYTLEEYGDPERQLHRHVLYVAQPGDVVVVDARGHLGSGVFGEMMLTYFKAKGGIGVVVDGCIRDYPRVKQLGLGLWLRGVTPNFHTQTDIFPFAVNVPIACGERLIFPGDIIIADDDGAVVVPRQHAEAVLQDAREHAEWEEFSRERLAQGGDLRKYYPLTEEAQAEYAEWRRTRGH